MSARDCVRDLPQTGVVCTLCPRRCVLEEGKLGFCHARRNRGGEIVCANYGKLTAMMLDPIEKKPLRRFYPGSSILSVGSYGCNLRCPFCQNSEISMRGGEPTDAVFTPGDLVREALSMRDHGNIGLAYTYNEPLVGYEFVMDCAREIRAAGMKNVLITNGCFAQEPLRALLPLIDAVNIDVKGFTGRFYRWVGGDLNTVKESVKLAAAHCHVEVTALIVPGENDSGEEMRGLASWLASVDRGIPLHVSRFFPRWHLVESAPTPVETIYRLAGLARESLAYVYTGNC